MHPKPPSKFLQATRKSTALGMLRASSLCSREQQESAQYENLQMQSTTNTGSGGRRLNRIRATTSEVGTVMMVHSHGLAEKCNADVKSNGVQQAAQQVLFTSCEGHVSPAQLAAPCVNLTPSISSKRPIWLLQALYICMPYARLRCSVATVYNDHTWKLQGITHMKQLDQH